MFFSTQSTSLRAAPSSSSPSAPSKTRLSEARSGSWYRSAGSTMDARTRGKLEALGLVPGSEFLVVSNSLAGLILKVKESRLAIGYSLAKEVAVVPIDNYLADNALPPEAVDTPVESQPQSTSADEGGL